MTIVAVALAVMGCDNSLAPEDVVGSYEAIRFVFSEGFDEIDVLAAGGQLDLTLNVDGSTSGSLFIPATVTADGQEVAADLAGTFTIVEEIIRFDQAADTFVRNSDWVKDRTRLVGGGVFDGQTIVAVLFRN